MISNQAIITRLLAALAAALLIACVAAATPTAQPEPAPTEEVAPAEAVEPTSAPAPTAKPAESATEEQGEESADSAECPTPEAGPVAQDSVLVPGPTGGLEPSTAPGERLVIAATVLDAECSPVEGATVHVWHTDAEGIYGPGHGTDNIDCCYYDGTIRTDANGRFQIATIRPGSYAGVANPPPAHIHMEVGHAEAGDLMTELVFEGDPALPVNAGRNGTFVVTLRQQDDDQGTYWFGAITLILGQ